MADDLGGMELASMDAGTLGTLGFGDTETLGHWDTGLRSHTTTQEDSPGQRGRLRRRLPGSQRNYRDLLLGVAPF